MKMQSFIKILFLLLFISIVSSPAIAQDIKADAPRWNYGDSWTYRDETGKESTFAVIDIRGDFYIGRWRGSRFEEYFDKNLILVKEVNLTDKTEKTKGGTIGKKVYDFPLYVGKKWKFTFDAHPGGDVTRDVRYENSYKVLVYEEVTVPAGKFMAFKIEVIQEALFVNWQQTKFRWYIWYAPEVKNSVRRLAPVGTTFTIKSYELISYQVK